MHINQDFAQSAHKSPAKRKLHLVDADNQDSRNEGTPSHLERAIKLLQEIIIKIDGAYAPSTIRAYRADFNNFIRFCYDRNSSALPAQPHLIVKYICQLTEKADHRQAFAGPYVDYRQFIN